MDVVSNKTLRIKRDVDRPTDSFLEQFISKFCKFSYAHRNVLAFLFKTYTNSSYAVENWIFGASNRAFQRLSVAHHETDKRIRGMSPWESNNDACLTVGVNIFRHLHAKRCVGFVLAVLNSEKPCLAPLLYYLRYKSAVSRQFPEYFRAVYEVPDLFDNPLCEVKGRVDFVERNEPSSGHMP